MASPALPQRTPAVYEAVGTGDLARVRALLQAGHDPDAAEPVAGATPLQRAIEGTRAPDERHELVRLLLAHGADPGALDLNGSGPLFLALLYQDIRVLELLLRHGADPNAETGYADKSLLWWARSDYLYETYGHTLPQEPDAATWCDIDALIGFLDALAQRHARPRPEALRLLRLYGARLWDTERAAG